MRSVYQSARQHIQPVLTYACIASIAGTAVPWAVLPAGRGVLAVAFTALLGLLLTVSFMMSRSREAGIVSVVGAWGLGIAGLFSLSALIQGSWGAFLGVDADTGSIMYFLALGAAALCGSLAVDHVQMKKSLLIVIALSGLGAGFGYLIAAHPALNLVSGADWFSVYLLAALSVVAFSALSARAAGRAEKVFSSSCLAAAVVLTFGAADDYVPLLASVCGLVALWGARPREVSSARAPIAILVCAALFNMTGFDRSFMAAFPSAQGEEYRPSVALSARTVSLAYAANGAALWIGDGYGAFTRAWDANRAQPVNESPLWDEEFPVGTALVYPLLVGSGALAVLFISMLSIAFSGTLLSAARSDHRMTAEMSAAATASVFLLWIIVSYVPSLPVLLLAVMLVAFGAAAYLKETRWEDEAKPVSVRYHALLLIVLFGLFSILLVLVLLRGSTLSRYLAALRADRTRVESLMSVEGPLHKVLRRDPMPEGAAVLSRVRQHAAQLRIESARPSSEEALKELRILVENAEAAAETAVNGDMRDFRYRIDLGSAYVLGYRALDDRSRLEQAEKFYRDAQTLAPRHPLPYLLRAKVLRILGREEEARMDVRTALALKSNYDGAWDFLIASGESGAQLPNEAI